MSRFIIIATIFMVIGLIAGLNMQQSQPEMIIPPISKSNDNTVEDLFEANRSLQSRITTLEAQQAESHTSQLSLSSAITSLRDDIKQIKPSVHTTTAIESTPITETAVSTPVSIPNVNEFSSDKAQVLLTLGIDSSTTERIAQREEKLEMDRLYLRNTAVREGWFGTEKYFEKTQGLDSNTNVYREELGDANYDRYLFNSNQSNRINVLSVIANSPAEVAGISQGDMISQYDHKAIFTWSELTKATTDGEAGQQVSLVIRRNDEYIELFVPRGPLGIRLENVKVNPNK